MTKTPAPRFPWFFLLQCACLAARSKANDGGSKFLWLSDLHFDPFYGREGATDFYSEGCSSGDAPSRGRRGCDSPLSLVQGAVLAAADVVEEPDFVLVTGDLARHGIDVTDDPAGVLSTIQAKVAGVLTRSFPGASVIPVLGNNDFVSDYYLDVEEANNTQLALAADALRGTFRTSEEDETFRAGGYLARHVSESVAVLSLNTVIYSKFHEPRKQASIADPLGQFQWMETRLSDARKSGGRVILVGHIPPTIGSYRKTQFWHDHYLKKYFGLLDQFVDVVSAQLYGHAHSDEFRIFPEQTVSSAPMLLTTSVTPVFGGNPSFRVVEYDEDRGDILDYTAHFLDLDIDSTASWQKLYSFRDAFGVDEVSVPSLRKILQSMSFSAETMDTFLRHYMAGVDQPPCDEKCQAEWVCLLQSSTRSYYNTCRSHWHRPKSNRLILAIVAAVSLAGFMVGVICYRRRRRQTLYEDVDTYNIEASDDISV